MDELEAFRIKLKSLGYTVHERPIRKGQEIVRWKLIAMRQNKSIDVEGANLLQAFQNLTFCLGIK